MSGQNRILRCYQFLLFVGLLLVVLAVVSDNSEGKTITVDDDGEGDYVTIQDAVDVADEGDTISVWAGTYQENVVVEKTLSIVGDGSEVTIIDGGGTGDVVRVLADGCSISGFEVTGCGTVWPNYGAGIMVEANDTEIFGLSCNDNMKGIRVNEVNHTTIRDSSFRNNSEAVSFRDNCHHNTLSNLICLDGGGIYFLTSSYNNITSCQVSDASTGFYLSNTEHTLIENCTLMRNSNGITGSFSDFLVIRNNTCSDAETGIGLSGTNLIIMNNSCDNNQEAGIRLGGQAETIVVSNNSVSGNKEGIILRNAKDHILTNNFFKDNSRYGIFVADSERCEFFSNIFENCGFGFSADNEERWNSHVLPVNNTVNGKPVYYYSNEQDLVVPSDAAQVILASCGSITVENMEFEHASCGVFAGYSGHITIANNSFLENSIRGVALFECGRTLVKNNSCLENGWGGISLWRSDHSTVEENVCRNNGNYGISIRSTSDENIVRNNVCTGNGEHGIDVYGEECSVTNNTCSDNGEDGLNLYKFDSGTASGNKCENNGGRGIYCYYTSSARITDNFCSNNKDSGIIVLTGDSVLLENNSFKDNQAYDILIWDSTMIDLGSNILSAQGLGLRGHQLKDFETHSISTDNTVEGKPVRYLKNEVDITVPGGAGQVILVACSRVTLKDEELPSRGMAVLVSFSDNITISGNKFLDCFESAVFLKKSENCTITGNSFQDATVGIELELSRYCSLSKNTMKGCGIVITSWNPEEWNSHTIDTSNSVNGKPVLYLKGRVGESVTGDAGQLIMVDCTNISVDQQVFSATSIGISVAFSTGINFTDVECNFNTLYGIYFRDVVDISLSDVDCSGNLQTGLYVDDLWKGELTGCSFDLNGEHGIVLYDSSTTSVSNCSMSFNADTGIQLLDGNRNIIVNSTIQENRVGIFCERESPSIAYNDIFGNLELGLDTLHSVYLARHNWWGHGSGPYHARWNPGGKGDNISYYDVSFHPWLEQPVAETPGSWNIKASANPNPARENETISFRCEGGKGRVIQTYFWYSDLDGLIQMLEGTSFTNSSLSTGTHTINLSLSNIDYSSMVVDSFQLVINRPPVVEDASSSPNPATEQELVTFTGVGSDDGPIVRYLWTSSLQGELYNGSESSFSMSGLQKGNHEISLKLMDEHGAWSEEESFTLEVKPNQVPTVKITEPDPSAIVGAIVTIRGTAADEDGDIESVEISIDGGSWKAVTGTTSWSYTLDTTTLENGEHEIRVKAYDGENFSETVTLKFTVDNKKKDDGGDDSPAFDAIFLLAVLGLVSVAVARKKKRF